METGIMEKTKKKSSKVNMSLLSQAIRIYEDRSHPGLNKAKTRGEVSRSTRKIYKQKGTGGARHGAKSAPIFVGGGVAHGPKGVKRILELPRKMAKGALLEAFKQKEEMGKLFIESKISGLKKTKEAKALLDKLLGDKSWKGKVLVVLDQGEGESGRAFRNIEGVKIIPPRALNVYEVFKVGAVVMDTTSASTLEIFGTKKAEGKKLVKSEKSVKPTKSTKPAKTDKIAKKGPTVKKTDATKKIVKRKKGKK